MMVEFKDNNLGIIVISKDRKMICYRLILDNDDAAILNAPKNMEAFESFQDAKSLRKLFEFLDDCFYIDDEVYRDGEEVEVHWTLKDLVRLNDYDNEYPKFKKKVNDLKTPDQIASITVFTGNYDDFLIGHGVSSNYYYKGYSYEWVKYDLEEDVVKKGTDISKIVDEDKGVCEPSGKEMIRILADK